MLILVHRRRSEPKKPGDPPQKELPGRGVVLSDGVFLGWREIRAMRKVPELVFVNCCHLAGKDPQGMLGDSRPEFAATVADELIRIGVHEP